MHVVISEPHTRNGKIVGYFLSMAKENDEYAGKYLTAEQYRKLTGNEIISLDIPEINPAPTVEVKEPMNNFSWGKK